MTWPTNNDTYEYRLRCWIAGVPYKLAAFPARRIELGQRTTCPVELDRAVPVSNNPQTARIDVGVFVDGGILWKRFVTGYFLHDQTAGGPQLYRGTIIDCLWKMDTALQSDIVWSNTTVVDALTDSTDGLFARAGLDASEQGFVFDPGTVWNLGNVADITIEQGTTIRDVFDRILEHAGLTYFVNAGGAVCVVPDVSIPNQNGAPTFSSGIDNDFSLPDGTLGLNRPERLWTDWQAVIISYTATGPEIDGATPNATVSTSFFSVGKEDGSNFPYYQTTEVCEAKARQIVRRSCARTQSASFRANLNPEIFSWQSIKLFCPEIGIDSVESVIVRSTANTGGITTFIIDFGPSLVATDTTVEPPPDDNGDGGILEPIGLISGVDPIASITYIIDYERDNAGNAIYYVSADGTGSLSNSGAGVTYSWDATTGSTNGSPTSSTEASDIFTYSSLTDAQLTLTVADASDATLTDTITVFFDDPSIDVFTRVLTYELDDAWYVDYNPDIAAAVFAPAGETCVAVPRYNEEGFLWAIFTTGGNTKVYRRDPENYLSAPEEIVTLAGSGVDIFVGEPFVSEQLLNTVLVAIDQSIAYTRNATGDEPTWQTTTATGETLTSVLVSAYNDQEFFATGGNKLFRSTDSGATWNTIITSADAGAIAEDFAIAPWGTAAVFSGASTDARRISFAQPALTVAYTDTPAGGEEFQTITPLLLRNGYKIGSSAGDVYLLLQNSVTPTQFDVTRLVSSGPADIQRAVRDGELPLAFFADDNGVYKQAADEATLTLIDSGVSRRVGFGPLRAAIVSSETVLIPTVGLSGGGVYEYTGGSWALRNNGLPATTLYGQGVMAEPNNPDIWYAVFTTNSAGDVQVSGGELVGSDGSTGIFWRWDGSTWANVPISAASVPANSLFFEFTVRGAEWAISVNDVSTFSVSMSYVFRGVGATQGTTASIANVAIGGVVFMADRTIAATSIFSPSLATDDSLYYVSGSGLILSGGVGTTFDSDPRYPASYPTGDRLVVCGYDTNSGRPGRVYATPDYRNNQITERLGNNTAWSVVVTTDERVYVGGGGGNTRTGIAEITDLFGTPSVSVVAASGVAVGRIGIDQQTRSLVAALNSAKDTVYLWDGTTETTIDASSLTAANLSDFIEVIRRS
jgi:hypothetical protein